MPITPLPVPPNRTSSEEIFAEQGDTFLSALPVFANEASALEENVNEKEASAVSAAATATAASNAAVAAVNATKWVSGTTYAIGDVAWSPINLLPYRRKTAGSGTTDPSADTANWGPMLSKGTVGLGNCDNTADAEKPVSVPQATAIAARVPAGAVMHWPKSTPPAGWLIRDGSAISRSAYAALFAVIGTDYGAGDGSTTFNLPDDRGLVPVGYKAGDSAFGAFGGVTGSKDASLVSHTHGLTDPGHAHGVYDPGHDHEERVCNIPGSVGGNFAAGTNADYGAHTGTYHTYGSTTGIGIYGSTTGISIQGAGGAATDKNIQPSRAYLPIIKY